MLRNCFALIVLIVNSNLAQAQTKPSPNPQSSGTQTAQNAPFDLSEYGVSVKLDARLIIVMVALDAAGFDPTPGKEPSPFPAVVSYLHTRPIVVTTERVRVKSPEKKKSSTVVYSTREHERRFFIVPDLMAAPATINFRVIADDYYATVPEGIDPSSSEMRRAFLQYVLDPLVRKFNKEINTHRDQIKQLIETRTYEGLTVSPDVFLTVSRSLVAAADARFEEANRLIAATVIQRRRLQQAKDDAARKTIANEAEAARAAIADEAIARLAEDYEQGAVLDFFFADQLREIQASGFDIANFFGDMVSQLDPAREGKRIGEVAATRARAIAARKAHPRYSVWLIDPSAEGRESA